MEVHSSIIRNSQSGINQAPPGGPAVTTLSFQRRGAGSTLGWGTKPANLTVRPKKKNENEGTRVEESSRECATRDEARLSKHDGLMGSAESADARERRARGRDGRVKTDLNHGTARRPVVGTWCLYCWGPRFNLWLGN